MYGQGNYASQYGQGLQRPMPPYQQHSIGHPGQPLPPPPPAVQQAGPPYAIPPHGSTYPHAPPLPMSTSQPGPPVSMSSTGNSYMRPPLNVHGSPPVQHSYPAPQLNYTSGTQNSHHVPPPLPPPPPRVPPPPPSHGQAVYRPPLYQPSPGTQQGFNHMPLQLPLPPLLPPSNLESVNQPLDAESQIPPGAPPPPPLPPSSPPKPPPPPSSSSPSPSEKLSTIPSDAAVDGAPMQCSNDPSHNRDDVPTSDKLLSSKQGSVLDLPLPPPKPGDEKIVRNIEVLCQFIAKNGSGFEDLARQKEAGNPEFNFLFGGEPGSEASRAHEYYLWMKKKCGLLLEGEGEGDLFGRHNNDVEPSRNPDSEANGGAAHSLVDSDVDMEDDITQSEKEPVVSDFAEDPKPEPVLAGDTLAIQNQENALQYARDSSPTMNLSPSVSSPADAGRKPEQSGVLLAEIDSPIRLIQNYASDDSSDDDGEPRDEETKPMEESAGHKVGAPNSHKDVYSNMNSDSGKASEFGLAEAHAACTESVFTKDLYDPEALKSGDQDKALKDSPLGTYELPDRTDRVESSSPSTAGEEKYASKSSIIDTTSGKEIGKEQNKKNSTEIKVDEFGRLIKEGASDSESDDSHYTRRHSRRGRSRSRSRSRSPSDRRRRRSPRRSPRRRKDRRSRSRSWSPKRRRSRSRSPYRTGGDFGGEKPRRDKIQVRECFDFLKGRCYRGASCRYVHHEPDKNDSSGRYKSKQHQLKDVARKSGFLGGDVSSRLVEPNDELKGEKIHPRLDKHDVADLTSKTFDEDSKKFVPDDAQPSVLYADGQKSVSDSQKYAISSGADGQFGGASGELICDLPAADENLISAMPSTSEQVIHQLQAGSPDQPHKRPVDEAREVDGSAKLDSSTIQTTVVSSCETPASELYPGNTSDGPVGPSAPTPDLPPPIPQLPSQASSQLDHKLLAPPVSFPSQPVPIGNFPAYQAPLSNQQSHYFVPPNGSWNILPPLQPRLSYGTEQSAPGAPFQLQQANPALRHDFPSQSSIRPHPGELQNHPQVGGFQHQPYYMHPGNLPTPPFGGPSLIRDDRYSQFPSQGIAASSSFTTGNAPSQHIPFPGDSTGKSMQSFPGDNMPHTEPSKPTVHSQSFSEQRPPYGPQLASADSMSSHLGGPLTVPGYSSEPLGRDLSSRFFDIGGSKIAAHYNPYASTFDQPLTTRFSSAAFTQEREAAAGLGHAPAGQEASGHESRKMILSPNSSRAGGRTLPKLAGDQYDPLFDSIEPSSDSFKKHAQKQDHAADNSDIMRKLSSRHKVLDVEENNKQKEVGVVAATTSLENDEYGETADAEVGAVENGSPSSPDEDAIGAEGEIEIDQVKPEGKSKKNKDSRSMKLFKVAVANFVKDVLKPQWRQGNMSKEVFKTIVKKTVDKVSGAMKNHRMPKSQAKIDHYIDSSRRKLTQLVEGYVSKYKS